MSVDDEISDLKKRIASLEDDNQKLQTTVLQLTVRDLTALQAMLAAMNRDYGNVDTQMEKLTATGESIFERFEQGDTDDK